MKKSFLVKCTFLVLLIVLTSLFLFSCSAKHTHEIEKIPAVQPTCTEVGYTEGQKCSTCTEIIVQPEKIDALGHNIEKISAIVPTCTEAGYTEGQKCLTCTEVVVQPEKVDALGHTQVKIPAVDFSCTTDGYTEGTECSVCQEMLIAPEIISAKHTEEIIQRIEPDVEKTGSTEGKKCSACNEVLIAPVEITLLSITVNEETSAKGQISCDLVFDDKLSGDFTIYYGNSEKQKLSYFNKLAAISVNEEDKTLSLNSIIIPSECEYLIATNDSEYTYFVQIPKEYVSPQDNYTFSSLSDVHVNKGQYLDGALDFLDTYGKIDFVAISGDVCDGEEYYYNWFNETISNRNYKTYTTTGNHDTSNLNNWLKLMNTSITTDKEVFDIAENGLDFVYIPEKNPDSVFIFFCQTSWDYSKYPSSEAYYIVTAEQLAWLEGVLEKYKDKTVLLYFHTFLSDPEGTQEEAVGNLKNPGGYSYDLPFSYGSADEVKFRSLMKEYKNVIYFSGHSHWMFELEIYNENLNVSNFDGEYCYMVHNPSVCEPRWIGEDDSRRTSMDGVVSEGWIIEMYDDFMILIPVDFISQVFYTEYMEIIPLN